MSANESIATLRQAEPVSSEDSEPIITILCAGMIPEIASNVIPEEACTIEKVSTHLQDRQKIGYEKYGTILESFNGRSALIDAYQQLLDSAMYLTQAYHECHSGKSNIPQSYSNLFHALVGAQISTAAAVLDILEPSPKIEGLTRVK